MSDWNGDAGDESNKTRSLSSCDDLEENYYSILNVPKNASDRDITLAYHRLGLIYHPDKHKDAESKRNAVLLFSKIKKVYDVLIDPHKRAIYDSVGLKGLEQNDLQIIVRSKTPKEIREEYERLAREKEEKLLEKLTSTNGQFTIHVDVTEMFDSYSTKMLMKGFDEIENDLEQSRSLINITEIDIEQSLDINLTNKNVLTLTGSLSNFKNYGSGLLSASLRHVLSPNFYIEFIGSIGKSKIFSIIGVKQLSRNCNYTANVLLKYKNGYLVPQIENTLNYQLEEHVLGRIKYKALGGYSSLTTSLIYEKPSYQASINFQMNVKNTFVSLSFSRKFWDNDVKLKTTVKYGFLGASFSYGIEKQVTKFTRFFATMSLNTMNGVKLNLEIQRGAQVLVVPVQLSNDIAPPAVLYGTTLPILTYFIVKKLIVDPYVKNKEEMEAKLKQEKLKIETKEQRKMAMAAQNLMKETVARIIEREGANGLIISRAIYGKITSNISSLSALENESNNLNNKSNDKTINVTIPIQFLVNNKSLLILPDQTKSNLEGFCDPCIGETKTLYIEYTFNGEPYKAQFGDKDLVRLPKATHKLQWWSKPFSNVRN